MAAERLDGDASGPAVQLMRLLRSMRKLILLASLFVPALLLTVRTSRAEPPVSLKTMLASPVDLTVYSNTDRNLVIGHSQYTIKEESRTINIIGETRYLNGEHDWERVVLEHEPGAALPVVTSLEASFFAANSSLQLSEKANFKTGAASCEWSHEFEDSSYEDTLDFPADTYAGAASVVPLEYALKKGEQTAQFHVFDCAPRPGIYAVDAKLRDGEAHWTYYPGDLAKMGLTPDLGWLNVLAKPFIPDITVWFDPRLGYQYVGTEKDRFYRGRSLVLVRNTSNHPVNPPAAAEHITRSGTALDPPAK
jgi:hypothetical protein